MAKQALLTKTYLGTDENGEDKTARSWFKGATNLQIVVGDPKDPVETFDVKPELFNDNVQAALAFHGLSQKLGDSCASAKAKGGSEPEVWAAEQIGGVIEALEEGRWVAERESTGPRTSLLAEALLRAAGGELADLEAAQTIVKGWDDATRKQVLDAKAGIPEVVAAYATIQAERAAERAKIAQEKAAETTGGLSIADVIAG